MDTAGKGLPLNFQGWFCAALKSVGAGLRSVGYAPLLFVAGFALRTLLSEVSVFWAAPCLVLQLEMVGFLGGFGLCLLAFLIVVFSGGSKQKTQKLTAMLFLGSHSPLTVCLLFSVF